MVRREKTGRAMASMANRGAENGADHGMLDKAHDGDAKRTTPRLVRTGLELARGAKSLGQAMRAAGYAASTSRSPAQYGVTTETAIEAYTRTYKPEDDSLDAKAERVLREVLDDDDAPAGIRAGIATTLHKMAEERPKPEYGDDWPYWNARVGVERRRQIANFLHLALHHNPERAQRILDGILAWCTNPPRNIIEGLRSGAPVFPLERFTRKECPPAGPDELYTDARVVDAEVIEQSVRDKAPQQEDDA